MYVLQRSIQKSVGARRSFFWQACGICGNGNLLERICAAQPDAKNWRVVKAVGTCADALRCCDTQVYGKAG